MKNTGHGITAEQWVDYLEGGLTPEELAWLEAHLSGCPDCRALAAHLASAGEALQPIGLEAPDPIMIERINRRVLRRVHQSRGPAGHLARLRRIVAGMCGEGTADGLIETAGR